MKYIFYFLIVLLMTDGKVNAQEGSEKRSKDKDMIVNIPTDLPTPPSAEKLVPQHPFSLSSSTYELMENLQDLEQKFEELDKRVSALEKRQK